MARSTKTERTVRRLMRAGAHATLEGGYYLLTPEVLEVNLKNTVEYLRRLPGGRRSKARKIGAREALRVREHLIAYPGDWLIRSAHFIERGRPLTVAPVRAADGPMGSGGPYARSLERSASADIAGGEVD